MKKNKKLWAALLIVVAIISFLANQQQNTNEEQLHVTTKVDSPPTSTIENEKTSVKTASKELPESHLQCKQFTNGFNQTNREWQVKMQENAADWLEEGYSQDEITYAIAYFRNDNFAHDWLVGHLVKDSRLVKENQALNDQFQKLLVNENTLSAGFTIGRVQKSYPILNLVGYQNMSDEERQDAIAVEPPTVEDIAAFIKAKELSEKEILELLSYVENPKEIITSVGTRSPIYLLEFAIAYQMHNVVEALLQVGAEPMSTGYLKNALELSLSTFYRDFSRSKDVSEHISLIKKLAEFDLPVRHRIFESGTIKSWVPLSFYTFDSETILRIEKDYGLNLSTIGRPVIDNKKLLNTQLISQLKQQKIEFLTGEYDNLPYEEALQNCKNLNEKISNVWKRPLGVYTSENQKLLKRYTVDASAVNAELALRDPDYIDCFRDASRNRRIYVEDKTELSKAYFSRPYQDQEWIAEFIENRDFSEEEMTWIFYASLSMNRAKDIKTLTELGFYPIYIDYGKFNWQRVQQSEIQYLNSKGLNTKTVDRYGKNMLYYAVKNNRFDLIKFMLSEHYPFNVREGSQDPLHLLLASWKKRYSQSIAVKMLPLIMSFKPEINDFHLARMKLLELRDNEFYLKIIEQFPELKSNDNTSYPDAGCR